MQITNGLGAECLGLGLRLTGLWALLYSFESKLSTHLAVVLCRRNPLKNVACA